MIIFGIAGGVILFEIVLMAVLAHYLRRMSRTRGSWISYAERVEPLRPLSGPRPLSKLKTDPIEFYSDSNLHLNSSNPNLNSSSYFAKNFRKNLESSYHLALETNTGTSVTSDNSSVQKNIPIPNVIPDMYV